MIDKCWLATADRDYSVFASIQHSISPGLFPLQFSFLSRTSFGLAFATKWSNKLFGTAIAVMNFLRAFPFYPSLSLTLCHCRSPLSGFKLNENPLKSPTLLWHRPELSYFRESASLSLLRFSQHFSSRCRARAQRDVCVMCFCMTWVVR